MKYFDTFTGIGGFTLGIQRSIKNTTCVGYSEIDKYASSIYSHHYPEHKNYGDITNINEKKLPDFDCLVGGFPCQAFSIAGKRGGFADTRGTLRSHPRSAPSRQCQGLESTEAGAPSAGRPRLRSNSNAPRAASGSCSKLSPWRRSCRAPTLEGSRAWP